MEKAIEIPSDDSTIYGTLVCSGIQSDKLIIHVHGLTHSQWGYLQLNSCPIFNEAGYDIFRFSFYDLQPKSRRLSQSTLTTHVDDLRRVIDYFQKDYAAIYLASHSLGGLVTLILNHQGIRAISLWDPSFDVTNFWESGNHLTYLPERNAYILDYGAEYLLGESMVEEIKNYPNEKCLELAKNIKVPTQLIIPEQSIFLASPHTSPSQYDSAFAGSFERIDIADAQHCFYGQGVNQCLFSHTLRWFQQFN